MVTLPPRRTVILKGELGDRYGREWNLRCTSPGEALAIIQANKPGMRRFLLEANGNAIGFRATIGDKTATHARLQMPFGKTETLTIEPVPVGQGSGKSTWAIIGGIALVALSFVLPGAGAAGTGLLGTGFGAATGSAAFAATLGTALVLGGISQLLAPTIGDQEAKERRDSYTFGGPGQRAIQGAVKPLLYGTVYAGSQPVSLGVSSSDYLTQGVGTVGSDVYRPLPANQAERGVAENASAQAAFVGKSSIKNGAWRSQPASDRSAGISPGGGKGGKGGSGASEAPDDLRSKAYAFIQDVLGEGEVAGPVDVEGRLVTDARIGQAIYFDDTPVQNLDGSFNFRGVTLATLAGTPSQTYVKGFSDTRATKQVGTEVKFGAPVTTSITDTNIDAVEVSIQTDTLATTDKKTGDVTGASFGIEIFLQYDGGGFTSVFSTTVGPGKTTTGYEKSWRLDLNSFSTSVDIRVSRTTPDATSSNVRNKSYFGSITEITDEKLNHPNTAKVALQIDAEQFNNIPRRVYHWRGIKVLIPNNYDPETREVTGVWDGGFVTAWTDNPAWIWFDLLTNDRYGLGSYVTTSQVLTSSLYSVMQDCDVLVSTGRRDSTVIRASYSTGATSIIIDPPTGWLEAGMLYSNGASTFTCQTRARPYTRDSNITSGDLIVGRSYRVIDPGNGAADFSNVGGTADVADVWVATATTPTAWDGAILEPQYFTITVDAIDHDITAGDTYTFVPREPRYTCNVVLDTAEDAYKVMQEMATVFRGQIYYGASQFSVTNDRETDAVMSFTNSEVANGVFSYQSTAISARPTTALVQYNDDQSLGKPRPIYAEEPDALARLGFNEKRIVAIGCSSPSQAKRQGLATLYTSALETEVVTFVTTMKAYGLKPGDVIQTLDNDRAAATLGGRLAYGASTTALVLDRDVKLVAGTTYTITCGVAGQEKQIQTGNFTASVTTETNYLVLSTAFSSAPGTGTSWIMQASTDTSLKEWRVLRAAETDEQYFEIVAAEFSRTKYDLIEKLETQALRSLTVGNTVVVAPPTNVRVETEFLVTEAQTIKFATVNWTASVDPTTRLYRIHWRFEENEWDVSGVSRGTSHRITLGAPGTYSFRVLAENNFGYNSGPVEGTFVLTNEGVIFGTGDSAETTNAPVIIPVTGEFGLEADVDVTMIAQEAGVDVFYTIEDDGWITEGGTLTSGVEYVIARTDTNFDVTNLGAPDNLEGTIFTASSTGAPADWGDDELGALQPNANPDPQDSGVLFNPNWLQYTQEMYRSTSDWVTVNVSSKGRSTRVLSPNGKFNTSFFFSSVDAEIYQDTTPGDARMTVGQDWNFSIWLTVRYAYVGEVTLYIEERGGAETESRTTLVTLPPPVYQLFRYDLTHQIEQPDRTTIRVGILYNGQGSWVGTYGAMLAMGAFAPLYQKTEATRAGFVTVTVPDTAVSAIQNKVTVRARSLAGEVVYSDSAVETYEAVTSTTAEPVMSPTPGGYTGTSYPQAITLTAEEGSQIYYTTDNTDPTTSPTRKLFSAPFNIVQDTLVRAYAIGEDDAMNGIIGTTITNGDPVLGTSEDGVIYLTFTTPASTAGTETIVETGTSARGLHVRMNAGAIELLAGDNSATIHASEAISPSTSYRCAIEINSSQNEVTMLLKEEDGTKLSTVDDIVGAASTYTGDWAASGATGLGQVSGTALGTGGAFTGTISIARFGINQTLTPPKANSAEISGLYYAGFRLNISPAEGESTGGGGLGTGRSIGDLTVSNLQSSGGEYTFDLTANLNGGEGVGADYYTSIPGPADGNPALFGVPVSFGPFKEAAGSKIITVQDVVTKVTKQVTVELNIIDITTGQQIVDITTGQDLVGG